MRVVTLGRPSSIPTRGLRGLFDVADERVYRPWSDRETWPMMTWGDEAPAELRLGYPARLGALYARQPLLTFIGLIGVGALGMHLLHRFGVMR